MIFPASPAANYIDGLLTVENGTYYLHHTALGATSFRWSSDYSQNWSPWAPWESRTQLSQSDFNATTDWTGKHIQVRHPSSCAC